MQHIWLHFCLFWFKYKDPKSLSGELRFFFSNKSMSFLKTHGWKNIQYPPYKFTKNWHMNLYWLSTWIPFYKFLNKQLYCQMLPTLWTAISKKINKCHHLCAWHILHKSGTKAKEIAIRSNCLLSAGKKKKSIQETAGIITLTRLSISACVSFI